MTRIHYDRNEAVYGEHVATQALQLIAPTEYFVGAYGTVLEPPISLYMRDFYHQVVRIHGFTSVTVTVMEPQDDKCNGHRPHVSGEDTIGDGVTFIDGIIDFSNLAVNCYPNGSLILQFDAKLGNIANIPQQVASPYYLKNYSTLHFRACHTGEVYVDGMCVACRRGSYSLEGHVTENTACEPCASDDGVDECWADQIVVSEVCHMCVIPEKVQSERSMILSALCSLFRSLLLRTCLILLLVYYVLSIPVVILHVYNYNAGLLAALQLDAGGA
jgi:hypothetical protein